MSFGRTQRTERPTYLITLRTLITLPAVSTYLPSQESCSEFVQSVNIQAMYSVKKSDGVLYVWKGGLNATMRCFWRCLGVKRWIITGFPPITLGITISTHLLKVRKVRRACHMFRLTLRAFRRLSCRVCAMSDLRWCK
jgi:hypothetical protein